MSVDHFDCACCETTGVYEGFIYYTSCCGKWVCDDCLLSVEKGPWDDGALSIEACPFCSGDAINDTQRIKYLIELLRQETGQIQPYTPDDIDKMILAERLEIKEN